MFNSIAHLIPRQLEQRFHETVDQLIQMRLLFEETLPNEIQAQLTLRRAQIYSALWRSIILAAVLAFIVAFSLTLAVAIYIATYIYLVPVRFHEQQVFFNFSTTFPTSLSPFGNPPPALNLGYPYKVDLILDLPDSYVNEAIGMFMATVTFVSNDNTQLATSSRPVVMKYTSWMVKTMQITFFAIPYILGFFEETQTLRVRMFDALIFENEMPPTVHTQISKSGLRLYSAKLVFEAECQDFVCLWSVLSNYRVSSAVVFTSIAFLSILSLFPPFILAIYLYNRLRRTSRNRQGRQERQQPRQQQQQQQQPVQQEDEDDDDDDNEYDDDDDNEYDDEDEDDDDDNNNDDDDDNNEQINPTNEENNNNSDNTDNNNSNSTNNDNNTTNSNNSTSNSTNNQENKAQVKQEQTNPNVKEETAEEDEGTLSSGNVRRRRPI